MRLGGGSPLHRVHQLREWRNRRGRLCRALYRRTLVADYRAGAAPSPSTSPRSGHAVASPALGQPPKRRAENRQHASSDDGPESVAVAATYVAQTTHTLNPVEPAPPGAL